MALTDHFGAQPSDVADSVIGLLNDFSCIRTCKRMVGADEDQDGLDVMLTAGLPAFLVAHAGGSFATRGANNRRFDQRCRIKVFCAASYQRTQVSRASSDTPTVTPGVEDLLDWATYYGIRGIESVSGATAPRPLQHRWLYTEPGKYVAVVELEYVRQLNCWDDAPTSTLQSLGIVKNPSDEDALFEGDNITPDSDEDAALAGGVFTLSSS